MLVDEWMKTFWTILNVKPKSLYDYQRLYIRHLQLVIGHRDLSDNLKVDLQRKILEMPPQSARHALMVAKSIWREAIIFGLCENNPTVGVRSPRVQVKERAFFTTSVVDLSGYFCLGRICYSSIGGVEYYRFDGYDLGAVGSSLLKNP